MSITEEYKNSLKMAEAEEILDLIFYRPIAFVIVKLVYRTPITPNQMTYGALVAGLISAFEFAQGTARGFAFGALWYAIANVLDCGDGMLARLQKSGTPLGRIVDGIVDWVSSVAIFFGLGWGMAVYFQNLLYWLPAIAAGVVSGYHAMVFDKRQQEYISTVRGERNFFEREEEKVAAELAKSTGLRKLLLSAYQSYMKVQEGSPQEAQKHYDPAMYRSHNKSIMRWWTWLGPTTNRTLLMIAALLAHPEWFCWFILIPANLYLISMLFQQHAIDTLMERDSEGTAVRAERVAA
jgi:phosphatidylglycerophosphate synthase